MTTMTDKLLTKLIKAIDDDFIAKVEQGIGLPHDKWGTINPKMLCLAILQTFFLISN